MNDITPLPGNTSPNPGVPAPQPSPPLNPQLPERPKLPPMTLKLPDEEVPQPEDSGEGIRGILSTLGVIFIALLTAVLLTTYVFQWYQVDGPSMETTLQNNDRLVVWKASRTLARITHHAFVPNRGDVVIFVERGLETEDGSGPKQLIKRVIGLPGERVVVKDGVVTVFNDENPEGFEPDKTLPYGNVIKETQGDIDLVVGKNQIFVCGDNRGNSLDSRYFGPVPLNDVVGKLVFRLLPLDKAKKF